MVRISLNIMLLLINKMTYRFFRHPDKTDHPGAENKFVEITKAYEVKLMS